jgi:hypothetical protein
MMTPLTGGFNDAETQVALCFFKEGLGLNGGSFGLRDSRFADREITLGDFVICFVGIKVSSCQKFGTT